MALPLEQQFLGDPGRHGVGTVGAVSRLSGAMESLVDRADQVLDFYRVRTQFLSELIEIRRGDLGESGFVHGYDLYAYRFQLVRRLML